MASLAAPEKFNSISTGVEQLQAEALTFIAQRLAGIEWQLSELNARVSKATTPVEAIAHILPKLPLGR